MASPASTSRHHRHIISRSLYGARPRRNRESVEYQGMPPEIWLHTFFFLQDDKVDLVSLTRVSRSFAALAQPLIFQHITIRPVCGKHPGSKRLACRQDDVEWITERMVFCTQERIAHAISSIEFSPTINHARREWSGIEITVVADKIIRMLPLFSRLRSFRCAHLILQPQHIHTVSGLTGLRSFHAINCHLSDHFHDHTYEVPMEEFSMTWHRDTADLLGVILSPHSHQRWFLFMHPDNLRTLNLIPLDAFLHRMLADLVDRDIQFNVLRSLSLPWMAVESKSLVPLLERVPLLQELRFTLRPSHRSITMVHPLPRHILPNLSVIEAPVNSLPFLLKNKSPQELSCATVRDGGSFPADIITTFGALPAETFGKLGRLTLDMGCLSDELLETLVTRVPRVTVLNLDVRGLVWGPIPGSLESHTTRSTVAFFLSLRLPGSLEYLYIGKKYATTKCPSVLQVNGDDGSALRSHFPFHYPSLREAHFYGANFRMIYKEGNVTTMTRGRP